MKTVLKQGQSYSKWKQTRNTTHKQRSMLCLWKKWQGKEMRVWLVISKGAFRRLILLWMLSSIFKILNIILRNRLLDSIHTFVAYATLVTYERGIRLYYFISFYMDRVETCAYLRTQLYDDYFILGTYQLDWSVFLLSLVS